MAEVIPRTGSQRDQNCVICGGNFRRWRRTQTTCSPPCGVIAREQRKRVAETQPDYTERQYWRRVEKTATCWYWHGALNAYGYGVLTSNREKHLAHRLSYEMHVGPIPAGFVVDHLCRVRNCVNPQHLRAVTPGENTMAPGSLAPPRINRDKTHCHRGHEFTPENTYYESNGNKRHCRKCGLRKRCRSGHEFTPENTVIRKGKRRCLVCERSTRQS